MLFGKIITRRQQCEQQKKWASVTDEKNTTEVKLISNKVEFSSYKCMTIFCVLTVYFILPKETCNDKVHN